MATTTYDVLQRLKVLLTSTFAPKRPPTVEEVAFEETLAAKRHWESEGGNVASPIVGE